MPDDPLQQITLTISKNPDGSYHYIDDGNAEYDGQLCGNEFTHSGGLPGYYTETGTFIFSSDTSATKTSTWESIPPGNAGGDCKGTLTKV